jgi:4-hydroxybenzoate polyprenyltransferase
MDAEPATPPPAAAAHRRGGFVRHLTGLAWAGHPLPGIVFTLAAGVFALLAAAAAHRPVDPIVLVRMLLGVYCTQVAIGATNDYVDRDLDAASGRAKPIVLHMIAPWEALALAAGATLVLLIAVAPLGLLPLGIVLGIEALGLAYDLRFKGTPVSALLYAVYFPLNPLLAWVVFGRWQPFLPWLVPLGALLGVAANVANSLPDLDADRAAGIRGLPHLLGLRAGLAVAWGSPLLLLIIVWSLDLAGIVPAHAPALLAGTAAGVASVALVAARYLRRPTPETLRLNFTIQGVGMLGIAAGWLAAVAF